MRWTFRIGPSFAWALGACLVQGQANANQPCQPEPGQELVFAYPSAETRLVPSNAIFVIVPDGSSVRPPFITLDQTHFIRQTAEAGSLRHSFDPGLLLTPGRHEVHFELEFESTSRDVDFELEAEAGPAPPPDQTSSVRAVRAQHFVPERASVRGELGLSSEIAPLLADPADCSAMVTRQGYWCLDYAPSARQGDYRIELEVEGNPLGFWLNDTFLPGHCRTAFFEAAEMPLTIQTVTETGVGAPQQVWLDVEERVTAEAPGDDPPDNYEPRSGRPPACSATTGAGITKNRRSLLSWLLVGVVLGRRRRTLGA